MEKITAEAKPMGDRRITLQMPEADARRLKHILMKDITWHSHRFGKTAELVYHALSDVNVNEDEAK